MFAHRRLQVFLFYTNNFIQHFSLHTVKWFQVLICNTNNLTLFNFSIVKCSNSSIWSIEGTLRGTTTPGQSGPGSNGNEGIPIPKAPELEPHHQMVLCHI